ESLGPSLIVFPICFIPPDTYSTTRSAVHVDSARSSQPSYARESLARDVSVRLGRAHDWRARVSSNAATPFPLCPLAWLLPARYARPVTYRDAHFVSENGIPGRPGWHRRAVPSARAMSPQTTKWSESSHLCRIPSPGQRRRVLAGRATRGHTTHSP